MKLFKVVHKFLIFDITAPVNRGTIIEQSFLCANQIVVCLKFLEKTVSVESTVGCLITSRQCFFERILWCLARLKSTVKSANDHVLTGLSEPENFITLLDRALDILASFDGNNNNVVNQAERRAELMMESRAVRETIEQLLSHSMAFANIALDRDKIPLTTLSQNVLKIAMDFEEEFSLSAPGRRSDSKSQGMKVIGLENSLCSLENFVNDALLRLVYEVFHVMDAGVIDGLLKIEDPAVLELEIESFDLLVDRLIQIGLFAIWFSRGDLKVSSAVRSCLASIESLDSYLIPAITSKSDPSVELLQSHFEDEAKLLQHHVQQIIDTAAFCSTLMEQLVEGIEANQKTFDRNALVNLVQRSNVLLHHIQINAGSLKLTNDKVVKFYFGDFKLILTECDAILNHPEPIENGEQRILKRFKILNSTTRKLQNAIKNQKSGIDVDGKAFKHGDLPHVADFPSKCADYFNTIRPSALGSILYESRRSIKIPAKSSNTLKTAKDSTIRRSSKKRNSLRIAIFKKHIEPGVDGAGNDDEEDNESMNLQITEILDKFTDLSTTLTKKF